MPFFSPLATYLWGVQVRQPYTPVAFTGAGTVVIQGTPGRFGIALVDIQAGQLGALEVGGAGSVWSFVKDVGTDGGATIALNALVYWDATHQVATGTSSANTLLGKNIGGAVTGANATVTVEVLPAVPSA